MSESKMREEFESAWASVNSDDEGAPGNKPTRSRMNPENYAGGAADFAWKWWQRSRESLVIELPTQSEGNRPYNQGIYDTKVAIESAGIKVKP
jgi:hypothetical protein